MHLFKSLEPTEIRNTAFSLREVNFHCFDGIPVSRNEGIEPGMKLMWQDAEAILRERKGCCLRVYLRANTLHLEAAAKLSLRHSLNGAYRFSFRSVNAIIISTEGITIDPHAKLQRESEEW